MSNLNQDNIVRRRIYDYPADLETLSIFNQEFRNEGHTDGHYYKYEFNDEPTLVCELVGTLNGVVLSCLISQHLIGFVLVR